MKIAFITCHFPPDSIGGGQVQSYRLCRALGSNHEVTVFTRDYSGKQPKFENVDTFKVERRKVLSLPVLRTVTDLFVSLWVIRKNRKKYDLFISFHIQLAALIVVLGKIMFGVIAVVSPRGHEDFDFNTWYKRLFQKFIYRRCSVIFVQSHLIYESFIRELGNIIKEEEAKTITGKVVIFPNLIDITPASKPSTDVFQIIYVGRLIDYKGVEYLIEAVKKLGFPYQLLIVGDGPDRCKLEAMSINRPIQFTGEIYFEKVQEYLSHSKILVLPSLTENLPNVMLESLALSIPVIATPVGAIPEIIQDGYNGYLIEVKNVDAITEKITLLHDDSKLYTQMSSRARQSIQEFLPETILPRYEKELKKIIEKHA